jgi:predicted dehydrogenase
MTDAAAQSIAVIGLGSIGLRHARNFMAEGARVCGYDPDAARRKLLADDGGVACETSAAALDGVTAAVIASPSAMHLDHMRAALDADCHLFVEKPLAHASDGLKELLDRARAKGRLVFAGLNLRLHPAVRAAHERISQGRIGRTLWARLMTASYLPDWRPHQDYRRGYAADPASGGIVLDLIHEIDLARHLMGPLALVHAATVRSGALEIDGADIADLVLRRADGAQVSVHLDYVTRPRQRRTEVAGENGLIEIDLDARRMTRWTVDGVRAEEESFAGGYADDYVAEARLFLDCIAGRARPACDGAEALEVLSLALAARTAAEACPA